MMDLCLHCERRVPKPTTLLPDAEHYPWDTGIKDYLIGCKYPPCSLLMLTNIVYNQVTTT
jgi:hypothetical protein